MYCYHCMNKLPDDDTFCAHCGRVSLPDRVPRHLMPGAVLNNRYMVGNALGEDGFSITYIGRDLNLGLRVAVKEYYPMGHVSRDSHISNEVLVGTTPEERAYFREGTDGFIEEARRSQEEGADVRDIFSENHTAYVVTAMPRQQTRAARQAAQTAQAAPRHDARYGDNFDGSEDIPEKDSVDIESRSERAQRQPQKKQPKKKKGPVIALIVIAVVVAALAVGGVILFSALNSGKGKTDPAATTAPTAAVTTAQSSQSSQDDSLSMPDTRGMKLSDAQGQLESMGLRVEISRENSSEVAKDYIIRQSVDAGQTLRQGDTVMLYVSDGAAEEPTTEETHDPPEFDTVSASSTRTDDTGESYDAYNLTVNDTTCWSAAGGDNGEWVRFGANSDQWVKGVALINGFARDDDSFRKNSRVTALRFEFSDGSTVEKAVEDTASLRYIDFGREVKTSSIKLTVIGHHDGDENKNICITYARPYL